MKKRQAMMMAGCLTLCLSMATPVWASQTDSAETTEIVATSEEAVDVVSNGEADPAEVTAGENEEVTNGAQSTEAAQDLTANKDEVVLGWEKDAESGKWIYWEDDDVSGRVQVKGTFLDTNSKKYYIDKDGYLVTGTFFDVEGVKFYAQEGEDPNTDDLGSLLTNAWKADEAAKAWYYFDKDGARDLKKIGLQQIDKAYYDLNADGVYQTGLQTIDGKKYFFNAQGVRVMGDRWLLLDGIFYYYGPDSTEIIATAKAGWVQAGSEWYYFQDQATIKTGWIKSKNLWYYMNPEGGAMMTGWYQANGKWYYSNSNGAMVGAGWHLIDNKWYYMENSGCIKTGWFKSKNRWYYLTENGMKTGWYLVKDKWYYSDGNGAMFETGWHKINGKWYWMENSGCIKTGWLKTKGVWYYLTDNGMKTGWYQVNGVWYYSNSNGAMQTGWNKIKGTWYYMKSSGAMATGWVKTGGTWYYMKSSGAMTTGWIKLDGTWYYLKSNGAMVTGLQTIGGKKYLFKSSGDMYCNGTFKVNGITYNINASGEVTSMSSLAMQYAQAKLDQIGHSLSAAFNWSAGIPYYSNDESVPSGVTNAEWYARYGFENGKGDCYVMASTFYWMAKALGYDVHYLQGYVPSKKGGLVTHGWCEIVQNGTTYVYDPNFTNETGRNGFKINYGQSGTWRYTQYSRLN